MKISKSIVPFLLIFVALGSFMAVMCKEILWLRDSLDNLYWIAENTHSGVVSMMIREAEAELSRRITVLSLLIVATAFVAIIGLTGIKHHPKEGK